MKTAVILMLRMYKRVLSPMLPAACRYVPTCSEYAEEAIERCGVLRGSMKAVWRLLRCHPFARGGFDPVEPIEISPVKGLFEERCLAQTSSHE